VVVAAVLHLGARSSDPLINLKPGLTDAISHRVSVRIAELAKAAGAVRALSLPLTLHRTDFFNSLHDLSGRRRRKHCSNPAWHDAAVDGLKPARKPRENMPTLGRPWGGATRKWICR